MSNEKTDPAAPPTEATQVSTGAQPAGPSMGAASMRSPDVDGSPMSKGERDRFSNLPAIEIELVNEVRRPPTVDRPWSMVEVWTQNRVYHIDVDMRCIEVFDLGTKKSVDDHGLLGARLLGGQHDEADVTYLSHPFPRPGTEAVFEQKRKNDAIFSHSSTVTRVVLRLRQISIMTGGDRLTWDQIAGAGRRNSIPEE
jgi:hypothetical protein